MRKRHETPDKDAVAATLARRHYQVEAGVTHIFRVTGKANAEERPGEPIKLLEVNENTVPAGILPLGFDPVPAQGILYPAVIIEVTPDEYEKIKARKLKLPNGWKVRGLIPRPAENGEA